MTLPVVVLLIRLENENIVALANIYLSAYDYATFVKYDLILALRCSVHRFTVYKLLS